MNEYVGKKMIADHQNIGGGVYFYEDYLEWLPRNYRFKDESFKVYYKDITSVQVLETFKKRIIMLTDKGDFFIDLYRVDTFLYLLDMARKGAGNPSSDPVIEVPAEPINPEPKGLDELERLAKLHESGALTDEEYAAAKQKILAKL